MLVEMLSLSDLALLSDSDKDALNSSEAFKELDSLTLCDSFLLEESLAEWSSLVAWDK